MKLLVLAAFIAVVSSGSLSEQQQQQEDSQWPWQTGKLYRYDVNTRTLAHQKEGASSGNVFKAQFIIRVKSSGRLQAKLENPQHAQFHQQLPKNTAIPSDLKFETVQNLDKPFEISVEGGRVLGLNLPSAFLLSHENLLKGLISTLQVDLSAHHHVHNTEDSYDKERQQGIFKKMEADVTGDCETLYTVSPVPAEWRRELPQFTSEEDPMEITKSKNYGHCHHRVAYHFGVPQDAEWTGTAHSVEEKQFISHSSVSRILAGKQGPIYKAETTSSVNVHPHLHGKQKAQVQSFVSLNLVSVEQDSAAEWQKPEGSRQIKTLLYAMSTRQMAIHDQSSESQESSSESHEHINVQLEEQKTRVRRSDNDQKTEFNKDWRSSSSSDSSSAYINDDVPRMNEPAYAALYMSAQSRGDKKQNTMNVQKLLQDIAQQLQNPNNMPKADFLSKFNILVRIIASMSSDQLAQSSRGIEVGRTSNSNVKVDMWMIFRDAVVQAGTPPAFLQIKTWITTKKLQGEEAAQVISTLARTLRYPTKEIMVQFFELAMSPEVQQQERLSTSALIAATQFIRMGQVNNETAHSYYPSHMYGRLARKQDRFVLDSVLPRLSVQLTQAIEAKEFSKALATIKAIGNLGHREIIHVFAPYLEGRIQVSTHLRVQMIVQLHSLVDQKDKHVRAVLFSILRNTAEPYEVRVAAILNIFSAHPTAEMMQIMAQMTNYDPSVQVRAALKNGIETAASLKVPGLMHLSRTAQAVKDIVTTENLGYRYSNKFYKDDYVNDDEQEYFRVTSSIGGDSSAIPKYQRSSYWNKIGGWALTNTIGASFSDAQEVLDFIKSMISVPLKSDANHKYSAQRISELLNIKPVLQRPIEGSFFYDIMNQERFYSYDEEDLIRLVQDIMKFLKEAEKGVEHHYTKVFNSQQVSVMFPIASGMPFIYKYKEPVVIHIQSKVSGKIDRNHKNPKKLSSFMEKELQFTAARNIDGSVGFMDTLSNQLASSGVVKKYQVNVPVKLTFEMQSGEAKMKVAPLRPDQDYTIAHFSVWPYTAFQKKDTLVPVSQDPTTKIVERTRKVQSTDMKMGQQVGTVFQLQGYSYSLDFKNAGNVLPALNNMGNLLAVRDIALTHYNLRYLGKQSQNKVVTLTAAYDELFNQKQSGELGKADNRNDVKPNSKARVEEMGKRVASGINSAKVHVFDISATFDGPQKEEFVLTGACATSPVDKKIQSAMFAGRNSAKQGNEQINAVVKITKPEISPLNFLEALKKNMKMTYEADIKFGQNGNIQIQGNTERTKKYTEQLKNDPMAALAQEEIINGNLYQVASHKMLIKAHAPDSLKASVTYKNMSPMYMNWTSQAQHIMKQLSWNTEMNPMKKVADGKLQLEVETSYVDNTLRFEMTSPSGVVRIDNLQIPDFTPSMVSVYSPLGGPWERVANDKTNYQHQPFCTVDGNKVRTFSNRSYDYELSQSWHLVMREEIDQIRGKWNEMVILARRPNQKQQEIYISYKTETGKDMEINISPSESNKANVQVKTSSKKISEGDLTMYWDNVEERPLLEYFTQAEGVLMVNIRNGRLRAMYDGQRLVLTTQDHRTTTRGICGQNSGEPRDDFETPHGVVDLPEHYGVSFALDVENSDPKTQSLKMEAQQKAYQSIPKYTAILRSDEEWNKAILQRNQEWDSTNAYRTRSHLKHRGQCQLQQQIQYYENHGEICITTIPLPSCQSHCHGEGYKVQAAQVICQSKVNPQFITYRSQIRQGQNPEVTGVSKVEQFRVPTSCKA